MINIHCDHESTQRGNCPFSNLNIEKEYKVDSLPKDTAEIET